jgi:hypothetical protein
LHILRAKNNEIKNQHYFLSNFELKKCGSWLFYVFKLLKSELNSYRILSKSALFSRKFRAKII